MCGIVGVCHLNGEPASPDILRRMTDVVRHRGPDDEGIHCDGPVGLGSRRLAVIDLTVAGHQPMAAEAGAAVLVYNGELYNFKELRAELEGVGRRFKSRSDTEVVLRAYEEWGESCLDRFNGHFAFAIWDRPRQRLFLARDRYGVRPLYYYHGDTRFLFASEVKAILAYPGLARAVSHPALSEYFTFQNILTDLTLFEGVKLLPAGCWLRVDLRSGGRVSQTRYWDFKFPQEPERLSETDAADELLRLFTQAVKRQLVSDVPLACYLSGGMDSGSITAVARRELGRLSTFTMGFDLSSASGLELGFDERARSEVLANLLKTEHYEMVLHAGDMEQVMPELIWHLEDLRVGQCYPNYYVARLASKFVKVVLSGAGGDELFGGYPWRYYRSVGSRDGQAFYRNYYDFWQRLVPDDEKPELFNGETWRHLKDHSGFDVFRSVLEPADMPLTTNEDFVNASLYFELKTFLHGILLVEDRVSMAHSLEARVPFLDNDLVEFALHLPPRFKLRHLDRIPQPVDEDEPGKRLRYYQTTGDGKWILRQAMRPLIPAEVAERTKQGFSAPDASWFRGESIDYVNRLLRDPKACIYEYVNPGYVARQLDEHTGGRQNRRLFIWSLLSLEWWLRTFLR
ncbi:MAG TPA: asparagine synthase (glutamine-hydrolyzing) [Gemmatimonadales bacterium]|jgi:asparagine synthase (glutamine-hydrolysing)|nr:asparagine synthase (glutamine-hydrolyzing) [Gemmatimonadales bacterium]